MNDPKYGIRDGRLWHRAGAYFLPDDEPVLLLRGKDPAAPVMCAAYIAFLKTMPQTETVAIHLKGMADRLAVITAWQASHPERVTHGCHAC